MKYREIRNLRKTLLCNCSKSKTLWLAINNELKLTFGQNLTICMTCKGKIPKACGMGLECGIEGNN